MRFLGGKKEKRMLVIIYLCAKKPRLGSDIQNYA